jgi:hypothetical protein
MAPGDTTVGSTPTRCGISAVWAYPHLMMSFDCCLDKLIINVKTVRYCLQKFGKLGIYLAGKNNKYILDYANKNL